MRNPAIENISYASTDHKKDIRREPCMSLKEVKTILGITAGKFQKLRTQGVIPSPNFYTGVNNRAYWHKSVVVGVKKHLDSLKAANL